MMARSISFRLSAKDIFLTYPQCPLPKEECLELLLSLDYYSVKPFYVRVCSDLHQEDGSPHLHCLLQFQQKFQTQNKQFFDLISSTRSTRFHPNIEGAENASAVQSYISKAGDYVDHGDFQPTGGRSKSKADKLNELYSAALATEDKELALSMIREGDPKAFRSRYKKLSSNFDLIFPKRPEPYRNPFPCFDQVPDGILKWAHDNIKEEAQRPYRPMSIIIEGPSRTGKTAWARSLGPHNYYAGRIDLTEHKDDVFFNVFDNVGPKYLKHWQLLIGSKTDWTYNCRYKRPRLINGGIPAIILCNPGAESSYRDYLELGKNKALREWTLANAEFFFIQKPFFSTSSQHQASIRHSEEQHTS